MLRKILLHNYRTDIFMINVGWENANKKEKKLIAVEIRMLGWMSGHTIKERVG